MERKAKRARSKSLPFNKQKTTKIETKFLLSNSLQPPALSRIAQAGVNATKRQA